MAMSIEEAARWADVYNDVKDGNYNKRELIRLGQAKLNLYLNDSISNDQAREKILDAIYVKVYGRND